jgi:ABC-type antimicrobial peptide transport system permease subunit
MFTGERDKFMDKGAIIVKYYPGKQEEFKQRLDSLIAQKYPDTGIHVTIVEEAYNDQLKSEQALLKLLGFVSIVCVFISIFGIFSVVTLTCQQRRKEIAIRKVNGATVKDILDIFLKENLILLLIASVVAFPVGYVMMKRWLESYVEQTVISAWIYIVIFVGIALIIFLSIIWRVWKAARQNPAEVVKSE